MATRRVDTRDLFTGEDSRLRLKKSSENYGLVLGDKITTPAGTFTLTKDGYGYWGLAKPGQTTSNDRPKTTGESRAAIIAKARAAGHQAQP
jgi:hypothetical protein